MRYQDITLIQVGSYAQVSSAYDIIDKIKVAIKQFKS
jgi:serine/threonine protein kinase